MDDIAIATVTRENLALLETALQHLAVDLNDTYAADLATLAAAVCDPAGSCIARLATCAGDPVGAVLASPVFSTMRGGAGLYVSDLWVARSARGKGLARRLLAGILLDGARWNAGRFLKLAVYGDNPQARAAYDRLGFDVLADDINMILTGAPLEKLKEKS